MNVQGKWHLSPVDLLVPSSPYVSRWVQDKGREFKEKFKASEEVFGSRRKTSGTEYLRGVWVSVNEQRDYSDSIFRTSDARHAGITTAITSHAGETVHKMYPWQNIEILTVKQR